MNILKRAFATLALVVASVGSLSAQFDDLAYRVEIGAGISKISNYGIGKFLIGTRIGGNVILPFEDSKLALQGGLFLNQKGEKSGYYSNQEENAIKLTYLQLPIEASFRVDINDENKVYLAAGPYLGYGLWGKIKRTREELFKPYDNNPEASFKRLEFGAGINVIYQYSNIFLKLGYEFSLSGVMNKDNSEQGKQVQGGSPKHGQLFLSIGYAF